MPFVPSSLTNYLALIPMKSAWFYIQADTKTQLCSMTKTPSPQRRSWIFYELKFLVGMNIRLCAGARRNGDKGFVMCGSIEL